MGHFDAKEGTRELLKMKPMDKGQFDNKFITSNLFKEVNLFIFQNIDKTSVL